MKVFDIDSALGAGYSQQEVDEFLKKNQATLKPSKTPPWWLEKPIIPAAGAVLGAGGGAMLSAPTLGLAAAPLMGGGAAAGYGGGDVVRRTLMDLLGYTSPNVKTAVENPPQNLNEASDIVKGPAIAGLAGVGSSLFLKYLLGGLPGMAPLAKKLLVDTASKGGSVPEQEITKRFGDIGQVNPKLIEGITSAAGKPELAGQVEKEIMNMGISAGGKIPGTTYADILSNRTGAYKDAGNYFVNLLKNLVGRGAPNQELSARVGGAYSDILHSNLPQTALYDQILSGAHQLKKVAGVGGGMALLNWILNRGKKEVTQTFIGGE